MKLEQQTELKQQAENLLKQLEELVKKIKDLDESNEQWAINWIDKINLLSISF